jgi:uncharacterized protein YaaN involved in tellurite resistance
VIASSTNITPKPPKGVGADELKTISERATALVAQFQGNPQDRRVAGRITGIGVQTQYAALQKSSFLKTKIKPLLAETAKGGGKIPDGLLALRKQADDLNPDVLITKQARGWAAKLLRKVPGMSEVLADIALKYDSAEATIDAIITGLQAAALERKADNEELYGVLDDFAGLLLEVRKCAYQGELMFAKLQADLETLDLEQEDKQRIGAEMQRLVTRIQDLRSMESVLLLSTLETNSIIDNNDSLCDTVSRVATITRFILTIALINQVALAKQAKAAKLAVDTIKYNSAVIERTAEAVGLGAVETARLLGEPVVALSALKTGFSSLITKLDEADRIKNTRIEAAKKALPEIEEMTGKLESRLELLKAAGSVTAVDALEQVGQ